MTPDVIYPPISWFSNQQSGGPVGGPPTNQLVQPSNAPLCLSPPVFLQCCMRTATAFTSTESQRTQLLPAFSFMRAENMYIIAFICYRLPAPRVIPRVIFFLLRLLLLHAAASVFRVMLRSNFFSQLKSLSIQVHYSQYQSDAIFSSVQINQLLILFYMVN
jgi:hypothetical protein